MNWPLAVAVWVAMAILMMANGALRERLLTPRWGELQAHQLSSLSGSVIVLAVCFLALPRLAATSTALQLQLGLGWLLLTIVFEFGFGHWVAGHSWKRLVADYDLLHGRLWLLVLLSTFAGPWLMGHLHAALS
jgi:hypothetical protein